MSEEKEVANIENMTINAKAKATQSTKIHLINLIENEYSRQASKRRDENEIKIKEFKDNYRKQVKYEKLVAKIDAAQSALDRAKKELSDVGLTITGEPVASYNINESKNPKAYALAKELEKKLSKIYQGGDEGSNFKDKIIARVHMSTTNGELAVIMNQILGNGVLPRITRKQLEG